MNKEKQDQLGAKRFGELTPDLASEMNDVSKLVATSTGYHQLLNAFGSAVVFDNGARFKTDQPSPLNDKDGYQSLEIIYGPGTGKHSLKHQIERYEGELPPSFVPIGEAPGGNLICVDKGGKVYLWDHESMRDEGVWLIAPTIDDFFARLEPDNSGIGNTDGIVESESFLDF